MSAFPSTKDQDSLMHELQQDRFFDVFEFNAPAGTWNCFLCNHPERAPGFMQENHPLMEGQLKEKRNKWLIFRRWRTRYFTLSGAHLSYKESVYPFYNENILNLMAYIAIAFFTTEIRSGGNTD